MTQEAAFALTTLADQVNEVDRNGLKDPNWIVFLQSCNDTTAKDYVKTVWHWFDWLDLKHLPGSAKDLVSYFCELNANKEYAPTTLRSKQSVFRRFFQMTRGEELAKTVPILDVLLGRWETGYSAKKANTFTKDNLKMFLKEAPDTPDNVVIKAFVPVAVAFAARGGESVMVQWEDIKYLPQQKMFHLAYGRSKVRGLANEADQHCLISGSTEIEALHKYFACFPLTERTGRFFRKLVLRGAKLVSTKMPVGKNTISEFGKKIAGYLKLDKPSSFTGHWPRRTSITALAESGRTREQIKCLTGHKSDSVVQGYINNTTLMKSANAVALNLDDGENAAPDNVSPPCEMPTKIQRTDGAVNITINLLNGSINAPLSLFNSTV